jgi:hypothetical protein
MKANHSGWIDLHDDIATCCRPLPRSDAQGRAAAPRPSCPVAPHGSALRAWNGRITLADASVPSACPMHTGMHVACTEDPRAAQSHHRLPPAPVARASGSPLTPRRACAEKPAAPSRWPVVPHPGDHRGGHPQPARELQARHHQGSTSRKAGRCVLPHFASDASSHQMTGMPALAGIRCSPFMLKVSMRACRYPSRLAFDA